MESIWRDDSRLGERFYVVLCVFLSFGSAINGIVSFGKNYCLRPQARLTVASSPRPSKAPLNVSSRQGLCKRGRPGETREGPDPPREKPRGICPQGLDLTLC